ncbi:unnamed protein product [Prorocentrum cordatum]|uniref:Phosphonoacetaldehyde hydrolase n=1 Tax=Prorocentrum cordatum TaxID=2364126 RepID=A0ABN9Q8K8_9DINO|nr:unnamed protein product [Polarella glacialis]
MTAKVTRGVLENIDLMVCDMAGTTVQGGLVYKTLQLSMKEYGLDVSDEAIGPWHGAKKEAVIEHFARQAGTPEHELESRINMIGDAFVKSIEESYFSEATTIEHIDTSLFSYFKDLKKAGVKIALDTGYPQNIQEGLVKRLGFDKVVDGWISSYDVPEGRPYPYMIHRLMERWATPSATSRRAATRAAAWSSACSAARTPRRRCSRREPTSWRTRSRTSRSRAGPCGWPS